MPKAVEVEPEVTLDPFNVTEAKVVLAILTRAGVSAADAKIALGQAQAKFEKALRAAGALPEEAVNA